MKNDLHIIMAILGFTLLLIVFLAVFAIKSFGEPINYEDKLAQDISRKILLLESNNRHIPCGYEGCTEYGVAQFKRPTFDLLKKKSGMVWLEYTDSFDQVTLLYWAVRNGYGNHWTTYDTAKLMVMKERYPR